MKPDTDRYYDGGDPQYQPKFLPEHHTCSHCDSAIERRWGRKDWCRSCLIEHGKGLLAEAEDFERQAQDLRVAAGKALEAAK